MYENMPQELSKEPANELNEKIQVIAENVILRKSPTTSSSILKVLAKNRFCITWKMWKKFKIPIAFSDLGAIM